MISKIELIRRQKPKTLIMTKPEVLSNVIFKVKNTIKGKTPTKTAIRIGPAKFLLMNLTRTESHQVKKRCKFGDNKVSGKLSTLEKIRIASDDHQSLEIEITDRPLSIY